MALKAVFGAWVLPCAGAAPIRDGGVAWRGRRIVAVGRRAEISALNPRALVDDRSAIILPGLINAHAHLELSRLKIPRTAADNFTRWLLRVIGRKRRLTPAGIRRAIRAGERSLFASGVTSVADIASLPSSWSAPRALRTMIFREFIGLSAPVSLPRSACPISPHAPYSVSDENFRLIRNWRRRRPGSQVMTHIGESPHENAYFTAGRGSFLDFYNAIGRSPRGWPGRRVIDHLDRIGFLDAGLTAVHLNDVTAAEARLLAAKRIPVAVCPGSLAYFDFSPVGVRRLISNGVRIVIGTDSSASNDALNMFGELRLARKLWGISARDAVEMSTAAPGDIFWKGEAGRLAPSSFADLILVAPSTSRPARSPYEDLFRGDAEKRIMARVLDGSLTTTAELTSPRS